MFSLNSWWIRKDGRITIWRGQVEWRFTEEVKAVVTMLLSSLQALTVIAVFGPAAAKWYPFLQKRIGLPTENRTIVARVAADQLLFSTTNMLVFLSSMSIMEGTDPKEKLKSRYWIGLKVNFAVWPLVQFINFKFVPLDLRVLVVNVVALGWNCFLSYLNRR